MKKLKVEQPEIIYEALKQGAEQINKNITELLSLHHATPSPRNKLIYPRLILPCPQRPKLKTVVFWDKVWGNASIIDQELLPHELHGEAKHSKNRAQISKLSYTHQKISQKNHLLLNV